jgi:hypothetical protein
MSVRPLGRQRTQAIFTAMAGAVILGCAPGTALAQQQPLPIPPVAIDGPSLDVVSLGGMAVARDGTGGVVYLKKVGGVPHVFVAPLVAGGFQTPVQLDTGFGGASTQPVIAAGNGGVLLVAFVNAGGLYVVDRAGSTAAWQAPAPVYTGASNPAIQMSANNNKAYLAFAAAENGGSDVRAAYYNAGTWSLATGPLNVTPGDDAGTGTGAPSVAAAGDGVGIVAWGEAGHVYARRVWGTAPSTDYEQADVASWSGSSEVTATSPEIASGGDSSYAAVAFTETVQAGSQKQTHVLVSRMISESVASTAAADGLATPDTDSAGQPFVAVNEYGRGWVTAARSATHQLIADQLTTNAKPTTAQRVDSLADGAAPYATVGIAGLTSTFVAWQQTSGLTGEIRLRYAPDGSTFGPEEVVSTPQLGPTDAAAGLVAGGDGEGDAVAAWVQGTGALRSIVAAQLFVGPGSPGVKSRTAYVRTAQPTLSWSAAREQWGAILYTVYLDGVQVGQTTSTSLTVPAPLTDGAHSWTVTATNLSGQTSTGGRATVWVDTAAPRLRLGLSGRPQIRRALTARVGAADAPALEPGARASGITSVAISWGDGATSHRLTGASHAYGRPGLYRIRVTATDRAGNPTTIARYVRILP